MSFHLSAWKLVLAFVLTVLADFPHHGHSRWNSTLEVIDRDVVVIGGGSSGTYTAVRLHQHGKSVALVEREGRLGGHVNTYVDSATNKTFDYGVIILVNITIVRDYFEYLEIPMGTFSSFVPDEKTVYADYAKRASVPASAVVQDADLVTPILGYYEQLQKYPYLASGFHLPDPIPEELLISYGDFLAKYNLSTLAYTAWYIDEGAGNILAQPALYMLKYFNLLQTEGIIGFNFATANNDYQALYDSALAKLGRGTNVLLNSQARHISRKKDCVEVFVDGPAGPKLIRAKQLVIAVPPLLRTLEPWLDITPDEQSLFRQFNHSYMWNGIVANTGFPSDTGIENVDPDAPQGIPPMPAAYAFVPSPAGKVHAVWYGSSDYLTEEQVRANILEAVYDVQTAKGFASPNGAKPEIVEFNDHSPYEVTVSVDAIKAGFYNRTNELQGQTNTWYTGAAWESHDSSAIWNFTEYEVLPGLLKALE